MQYLSFIFLFICLAYCNCKGISSSGGKISSGARISVPAARPVSVPKPVAVVKPQPIVAKPPPPVVSRPIPVPNYRPVVPPQVRPPSIVVLHPPPARVIVVRPQPRPIVTIQTNRVVIIKSRPPTYIPIITPIYRPYPLYSLIYTTRTTTTSNQQQPTPQYVLSEKACSKNDKTIYGYCQDQVQKSYDPETLNATWRTCCSAYAEVDCYMKNAADWCSADDAKALLEHSINVAKYFGSTICRIVDYTTWDSTCANIAKNPANFSDQYYSKTSSQTAFISIPNAEGNEKSCFDKMRTAPEGDLTQKCLNASLDVWDPNRRKLVQSSVWEPCCAMYDSLDCLQLQASSGNLCTETEQNQMANFKTISANAFSNGICRSAPYDDAPRVCRGVQQSTGNTGGAFSSMPSISLLFTVFFFVAIRLM